MLCRVESLNNRTAKFTPDLGTFRLETRYGIYKVTVEMGNEATFDKIPEFGQRLSLTTEQEEETTTFNLPGGSTVWLHYLVNLGDFIMLCCSKSLFYLEEGINFPHDGLYIEYCLELPPNMELLQKDVLFGRTQICFTQERGAVILLELVFNF